MGGGGDLVVCLSPFHHVAPETKTATTEESSLALCTLKTSLPLQLDRQVDGWVLH